MISDNAERTRPPDEPTNLADRAADRNQNVRTDSEAPSRPLQSILRVWRLITATREAHDQYRQASRRLQALEQDNLKLKNKVEHLTRREASARYLATHDGLTGLCNRSLLMDRFVQAAAHAERCGHPMALLLFDLDGFKAVNDRFGHLAGDQLLQHVADRLVEIARAGDTVCRYGGDEFVMLLPGIDSLANAEQVAQRVRESITDCLLEDDIQVEVRASCGIALYPDDGDNWHDLMEAADAAMYHSKPGTAQPVDADKAHDRRSGNRDDRVTMLHSVDTPSAPPDSNDNGLET